jgi:hypothetical protein
MQEAGARQCCCSAVMQHAAGRHSCRWTSKQQSTGPEEGRTLLEQQLLPAVMVTMLQWLAACSSALQFDAGVTTPEATLLEAWQLHVTARPMHDRNRCNPCSVNCGTHLGGST